MKETYNDFITKHNQGRKELGGGKREDIYFLLVFPEGDASEKLDEAGQGVGKVPRERRKRESEGIANTEMVADIRVLSHG